jgi:O-antigen ligase
VGSKISKAAAAAIDKHGGPKQLVDGLCNFGSRFCGIFNQRVVFWGRSLGSGEHCVTAVSGPDPRRLHVVCLVLSRLRFAYVWNQRCKRWPEGSVSRYVAAGPIKSFHYLCAYTPVGAVLCLVPALYQFSINPNGVEGGAGNASVFGFVSAVLGSMSLANVRSASRLEKKAGFVGFVAGMCALLLSSTRALYPIVALAPAVAIFLELDLSSKARRSAVLLLLGFLTIFILLFSAKLGADLLQTNAEVSGLGGGSMSTSLGIRIELWKAALQSVQDSPILGHGRLAKMEGVYSRLPDQISYIRFTHAHNSWIDSALAAGLSGPLALGAVLFSPLWMIRRNLRKPENFRRNIVVFSVVLVALFNSFFNTTFTNDVMTVLFLIPLIIVSAATRAAPSVADEAVGELL